jgi:dipeptidyl aminopeptidase/acylaminoacyl peptidase
MRRLRVLFAVFLLTGLPLAASAQQPPLIDRELFFGDPEIAGAQISPDGQFISFRKPYRGVMNIWVKKTAEPFTAARPMTADTTRPVSGYFWSQDSRYLLYVQDKGGNENYHIYAVDPSAAPETATGVPAARDLTPYGAIQARITAVPRSTPNSIVVSLNDRDPQWHDVYRVDLATGERTLVLENKDRVAGFLADQEGTLRMATRIKDDGGTELLRVNRQGGMLIPVYDCSNEETCGPIRVHKDGRRIYMITNKGDDVDLVRLVVFDPHTRGVELVESDPEGQVDLSGAAFSDLTGDLLATVYIGDRVRIYPKTPEVTRDFERLRKALPDGELGIASETADERFWIVSIERDVDPGAAYLYDRQAGTTTLLYRSRPTLPSEHLAEMKPVRYPARDGLIVPAYLSLPRGVEPRNLPTVIMPHGGPWGRDMWGYDAYAQFLANRGYAVLQPNFRASTGYGKRFLNAGNRQWGIGSMQHDISDGVAYLVREGIADPQRVAIFGGSYGGYATLAGVAFTPDLYAAGVSYVGPSNLLTLLASIPPYWAPVRKIFNHRLGNPDDPADVEMLKRMSPINSADQIRAPLLVIQGANDPRVNKAESEQIVVSLRDRGRPVEYLLAPDEGHGFAGRENRLVVAAAMERFLARHIGGRYQETMPPDITARLAALTVDPATVVVTKAPPGGAALAETMLSSGRGTVLAPATLEYLGTVRTMSREQKVPTTRILTTAGDAAKPLWRVVDSATMGAIRVADTLEVDGTTLLPLRRAGTGGATVDLAYTPDKVSGRMVVRGQTVPVDVKLQGAVFGEGAGQDLLVASLPLAQGYEATFQTFSLMSQKVRPMQLEVTGTETVTTPAGTFDTWVVTLRALDADEAGSGTLNVTRDAPHVVVKSNLKLPATMGGGTYQMELTGRK